MNVKVEIDSLQKLLVTRGLEERGRVQKFVDSEVVRFCRPYTPFESGLLADSVVQGTTFGSGEIVYNSPYAKYLYYGKVMVSPSTGSPWAKRGERKVLTGKDIRYQGSPKCGSFWLERMKADHLPELLKEAAEFAGGRVCG